MRQLLACLLLAAGSSSEPRSQRLQHRSRHLPLAAPSTTVEQQVLLARHAVNSADPLAVCNDGSEPAFYFAPPTSSSTAWMIILPGTGNQQMPWCFPPDEKEWGTGALSDCYWSAAGLMHPLFATTGVLPLI